MEEMGMGDGLEIEGGERNSKKLEQTSDRVVN